jgi:hypothetical protein
LVVIGLAVLGWMFGDHSSKSSSTDSSSATSLPTPTVDAKELLIQNVKLDFKWRKEGFDDIMKADFTLNNPTAYRFKDSEIRCSHYSPRGTVIDSNTRTIYQVVEPESKKVVKNFDMGFIHSQVASSSCKITDLTIL